MNAPANDLFVIEPVRQTSLGPGRPHDFNTITCSECGEVAVER